MKILLKKFLFLLQMCISTYSVIFISLYRVVGKKKNLLVNHDTKIVIEGFPRSGNTFSVVALEWAQNDKLKIAHHLHAAAQLIWAVRHNIPAVALIRSPASAVVSLSIREPHISLKSGLHAYIRFYEALLPLKSSIVVVEFEQVISSYGESIKLYNEKFDLNFKPFDHTEENVEKVFDLLQKYSVEDSLNNSLDENKVARPSAKRKVEAKKLNDEIITHKYASLLERANKVYNELTEFNK